LDLDAVWGGEWDRSSEGVLYEVVIVEGKGQFWGVNVGHFIVTNGTLWRSHSLSAVKGGDAALTRLLWD